MREGTGSKLAPKSEGSKLMVSDFVCEEIGFLAMSKQWWESMPPDTRPASHQARLSLLIGKNRDGYFTGERFEKQLGLAMDLHEILFPGMKAVFMLDWSGCHRKADPSAIDLTKLNVTEGGKQPVYGVTTYNGPTGPVEQVVGQKGLRKLLEERGVDTSRKTKDELINALRSFSDFATPPQPLVEMVARARGHEVIWIPKYHCELNPIELVWGIAKRTYRRYATGSLANMRELVPRVLAYVGIDRIRSFARRCRDFARAYMREEEHGTAADVSKRIRSAPQLEEARKVYRSHRRVFLTTLQRELEVPERELDALLPDAPGLHIENDEQVDEDEDEF